MKPILFCRIFLLCGACVFAQDRVDSRNRHERIIAVVPITGAGTYADPRRPLFAPAPNAARGEQGILEYQWTPSDDGNYAVVEFVAKTRAALAPILADSRTVRAFEKGRARKDYVETEIRKYRRDFSFEQGRKP
jgi:hypothetical protein